MYRNFLPFIIEPVGPELTQWRRSDNKDDLTHYDSEDLRRQYAHHEMQSRSRDTHRWLRAPVRRLLEARVNAAGDSPVLQLLSLGCGPGSDLLGALHCIAEARKKQKDSKLPVECTGVDLHGWDWTEFWTYQNIGHIGRLLDVVRDSFELEDMSTFVAESVRDGAKFDLITMSYANAKAVVQPMLTRQLPKLLDTGGSIVIIDNDSCQLRGLCSKNKNYKVVHKTCKKIVIVYEK